MDDIMAFSEAVDINIKVGKNTDASGPLTLFSRLQQIADFVDTLETKLGLNTDSSGTTTVFARLAQISAFVDTLETSIGTNVDASGTSTVFARLAQIAAYVDQVEGYTDTLETLLGLTGDAASGTGSVMARLAQIIAYTDTVETVLGTVNTNVNSANTTLGSVNTNVNTANTNINTTNTRIGANTDAAGTSTLFALLKKLDTATANSAARDKSTYTPFYFSGNPASQTTYQTVYSLTGKSGFLSGLYVQNPTNTNCYFRVTADGVNVAEIVSDGTSSGYHIAFSNVDYLTASSNGVYHQLSTSGISNRKPYPYTNAATIVGTGNACIVHTGDIWFNNSLTIEIKQNNGSGVALYHSYFGGYK